MLPSMLAKQLEKGIGDYIETTFPMTNEPFRGSIRNMLNTKDAVYHEPYVSVRLPFRVAETMPDCFEAIHPAYLPYVHQQTAFERLTGNDGRSTLVATGTGSGKTTFLNALSEFIPKTERVITIEDNAELQIRHIENLVTLEARNANVEGCEPITIRDLIRSSLRMRPDRIIVGEVRADEAIDMLQAYNTGHDGSLSTGHANSASDMMTRLETMVLMGMDMPVTAVRDQIGAALDIVVHLGRIRDKSRKVLEISEVRGVENGRVRLEPLFRFKEKGEKNGIVIGSLERTDAELENKGKFEAAGIGLRKV